ncbi:MAG: thioredoxin domain-containing protein [Candidatus Komeilibacteria bacterium]|nr:thioredoxin domain-containing protein [Candidatus Komeilibacteria bacterium]
MEVKKLIDHWWFRIVVIVLLVFGFNWLFLAISHQVQTQPAVVFQPKTLALKQVVDPRLTAVTPTTPTWGNPKAKITIVEFGDFQCPYSEKEFSVIREVMNQYKEQIFFIWRQFPIADKHPQAAEAAEASVCAEQQDKFWPFHDQLFLHQTDLSSEALLNYAKMAGLDQSAFIKCMSSHRNRSAVIADLQLGLDNRVNGTPTFFINGTPLSGALPKDFWDKAIDYLLGQP